MKNFNTLFTVIAVLALIGFAMASCDTGGGSSGSSSSSSGGFDGAKLVGIWAKDDDSTIGIEFSDYRPDGVGNGPTIDYSSKKDWGDGFVHGNDDFNHAYAGVAKNGVIGESFKVTFEGEKIKLSNFTGNKAQHSSTYTGTYTKQP